MRPVSIRRSLMTRIGFGIGILLVALSIWIYLTLRHGLFNEVDKAITQTAALLSNQVELENGNINFEWKEGIGTNQALHDDALFQFWDETTGVTTGSPGLRDFNLPKFSGEGVNPILKDIDLPKKNHHARAIGIRVYPFNAPEKPASGPTTRVDPKTRPHILVVAQDTTTTHRLLVRIGRILSLGTILALGIVYLLVSRVIRISLRPIDDLTQQMKNRTENQLDAALVLPINLPTELNGLAENFDSLLSRVASARLREGDFIRHAAHELRTPIAGLRAVTDLALSRPRSSAEYASHLATCQTTAIELSDLVSRLTALSRVGQQTPPVPLHQIDIIRILNDCLSSFSTVFKQRDLGLSLDFEMESIWAPADETLARIIFNNLLDNASCYTGPGGEIRITARKTEKSVEIIFANTCNIPQNHINRLFEPLFRSDFSRHDAASHLGIGLTLSREAATAMNASLIAHERTDGWIEFIFTL
jgi:signal transduction histidine kinase